MPPVVTNFMNAMLPVPAVLLIVAQAVAMTWWASGEFRQFDARITALERTDMTRASHEARIIVLEQSTLRIDASLLEIKTLLREATRNGVVNHRGSE